LCFSRLLSENFAVAHLAKFEAGFVVFHWKSVKAFDRDSLVTALWTPEGPFLLAAATMAAVQQIGKVRQKQQGQRKTMIAILTMSDQVCSESS
jgi:hypothetical protein